MQSCHEEQSARSKGARLSPLEIVVIVALRFHCNVREKLAISQLPLPIASGF